MNLVTIFYFNTSEFFALLYGNLYDPFFNINRYVQSFYIQKYYDHGKEKDKIMEKKILYRNMRHSHISDILF